MKLIEKLREMPSERLLCMRAEGDDLADEWHRAIEAVFLERGESLPPIPTSPVLVGSREQKTEDDALLSGGVVLIAVVIGEYIKVSGIGIIALCVMAVWFVAKRIRRSTLNDAQREEEIAAEKADALGMTELMRCAADGRAERVRELLAYDRGSLDARSNNGATALIFAARNGHSNIVNILLDAGANHRLSTDKGLTASTAAHRFGHSECQQLIDARAVVS